MKFFIYYIGRHLSMQRGRLCIHFKFFILVTLLPICIRFEFFIRVSLIGGFFLLLFRR